MCPIIHRPYKVTQLTKRHLTHGKLCIIVIRTKRRHRATRRRTCHFRWSRAFRYHVFGRFFFLGRLVASSDVGSGYARPHIPNITNALGVIVPRPEIFNA